MEMSFDSSLKTQPVLNLHVLFNFEKARLEFRLQCNWLVYETHVKGKTIRRVFRSFLKLPGL